MKVLMIVPQFLPVPAVEGGAVETLVDAYLKNHNQNIEITVYSKYSEKINRKELTQYNNVEFRYIQTDNSKYQRKRITRGFLHKVFGYKCPNAYLHEIIKDLKYRKEFALYDKVVIQNMPPYIIGLTSYFKGKLVLHLHNDYLNLTTKKALEILNCCQAVYGVSNFICDRVRAINPIKSKNKVFTLYNGVDLSMFQKDTSIAVINNLKQKYNIKETDFIFLYSGRVMPGKGVDILIRSFEQVFKINPNSKLLILGGARGITNNEDEYVVSLKKQTNPKCVIFTGRIQRELLPVYASIAHAQVVPSCCNEAFGLVAIEAMAMNLPLIVTTDGALPEITEDAALLVPKETMKESLECAMKNLYQNSSLRNTLIKNGKNRVTYFSLENYCKKFDFYILKR